MKRLVENWLETTSDILSEEVGTVLSEVIIDEILEQTDLNKDSLTIDQVRQFLRELARNLPDEVDQRHIIQKMRAEIIVE